MNTAIYHTFLSILNEELIPALGCTEPIAIAYASAKAREVLGAFPDSILVRCSGNIIKNVQGVIVPTTGNMRGVDTSAVLGAVAGDASLNLEVLSRVRQEDVERTKNLLGTGICTVELLEGVSNLHIIVEMHHGVGSSLVEIAFAHTNIIRIERNGTVVFRRSFESDVADGHPDYRLLNLHDIFDFVDEVRIDDIKPVLDSQIACNMKIAQEGLENPYGANVGATLVKHYGDDVKVLAKAFPAAGSDARMNGCTLPVVINSGSGNQGMTVSLPVIVYAEHLHSDDGTLYRALVLSNLVAIYQKSQLGKLSAYCGAVSAAVGAGAGIAYLHHASRDVILDTITNTIANVSGIVCDGAKASCAAKIASSVDAAEMGYYMASDRHVFPAGEGLVKDSAERTISSYDRMGREGMRSTDVAILNIMLEQA